MPARSPSGCPEPICEALSTRASTPTTRRTCSQVRRAVPPSSSSPGARSRSVRTTHDCLCTGPAMQPLSRARPSARRPAASARTPIPRTHGTRRRASAFAAASTVAAARASRMCLAAAALTCAALASTSTTTIAVPMVNQAGATTQGAAALASIPTGAAARAARRTTTTARLSRRRRSAHVAGSLSKRTWGAGPTRSRTWMRCAAA